MAYQQSHHAKLLVPTEHSGYLQVNLEELGQLRDTPLYMRSGNGFVLFKDAATVLRDADLSAKDLRDRLFVKAEDRELIIAEIQREMADRTLRELVKKGEPAMVKAAFSSLMEEAFMDPRIKVLHGFKGMVDVLAEEYAQDQRLLQGFLLVAEKSYGLAEHSVNVMALLLTYAMRGQYPRDRQVAYALTGLMHDIGKTTLPEHLRLPHRQLTEKEFARYSRHPEEGQALIKDGGFEDLVLAGVSEHHERLDGSGYPLHLTQVSEIGQAVGLADSYEYLTSQDRTRGKPMQPIETLRLLKKEVEEGKFGWDIFERFAYSLT